MTYSYKHFCSLLVCLTFACSTFGETIYVNANAGGGNNGQSWTNAFLSLSDALSTATAGDQIWVSAGTYYPTAGSNRSISFVIPSGVEILGGFPNSGNPTLANRNPQNNATILSGDIDQSGTLANNSYTLIYTKDVNANTVLDGFTVTGGNANGGVATNFPVLLENGGAAWYNEASNFVNSNPTIRNCIFSENYASNRGGAMYHKAASGANTNYIIENTVFQNNNAAREGGAIFNAQSGSGSFCNPTVSNTTFQANTAGQSGGAIYNNGAFFGEISGTYTDCDFTNNLATANEGAAVYNNAFFQGNTNPIFTNCNFIGNNANPGSGGAIYTDASGGGTGNFKVINCLFENNSSDVYGGAICNIISNGGEINPTYANCIFKGNTSVNGGATYSRVAFGGEIDVLVTNCVFYDNVGSIGGAIYQNATGSTSFGNTQVANSIFQDNTAGFSPTFHLTGTPTINVNNSLFDVSNCLALVQGEGSNESNCNGGILYNQNPQFVNPSAGDFHLLPSSPAIDAGNNSDVPSYLTTDSDGNSRIAGGVVDMGVYEQVNNNSDTDGDGIFDTADNCPLTPNPNQADVDGDGVGTLCDCDDTPATGISCSTGCSTFYADADGDGFGNPATGVTTCIAPNNYVSNNQDFNDNDNTLYPNAPELCDGKDNDNNGQIDEGTDDDNDGVCNEDDICPGGDDNIDLNNNNIPDACESQISVNCPSNITVSAAPGQGTAIVNWTEPAGATDCNGGGTGGSDCSGDPITGFTYKGTFEGHDYYLSNGSEIWTDAQATSVTNGGNLVVINSQAENDFVKSIIGNEIILIGLSDAQTEGDFQWTNGDPLTYNNLQANPGGDDYGIMYFWDGTWVMSGNYGKVYLLEKPCGGGNGGGLNINQTAGPNNGSAFPVGTTAITYTATDDCGGSTTCTFNVTVEASNSSISINCPNDISVTADPGATSTIVSWTAPTPTSNCPTGTPNATPSQASGTAFPIGTTTVTYTVTDDCGGSTSCSFTVTVNEGTSIVNLICPNDIVMNAAPGATSQVVNYQTPIGNTTCATGGVTTTLTSGLASGATFPIGTTIVEYQGTDQCNASAVCSFSVTINATNSNISLNCPSNITENVGSATGTVAVTWNDPTGSSSCASGGYSFSQAAGPAKGSQFGVGSTTITYTASDNCGGTVSCSFVVTVNVNSSNISLNCPTNLNISVPQGTGGGVATWSMPTATTDCTTGGGGGGTCTGSPKAGFTYIGEYNGSDYYISDGQAPWLTAKANCETAGGTLVGIEDADENDYVKSVINGQIVHIGLTDEATEGTPVWLNGEPTTYSNYDNANNQGNDYTVFHPWDGTWGWIDNGSWKLYLMEIKCGGSSNNAIPVITQTVGPSSGSNFPVGSTTITYQATDDCGNLTTCSFTVNVIESAATCNADGNGGQISGNEIVCDAYDPQTITSSSAPSGGSGTIEYVWLKSESGCPTNINQAISNSNSATYNPPLINVTTYYVRWSRRANCTDWVVSNCITKTVDDCGTSTNYCDLSGDQPWQEWIDNVELADLSNPSQKSLGYEDYTNLVANLTVGQQYTVSVNLTFSYNQWDENVYVWMDFNQDNDFNDPGELVLEQLSPSNGDGGPQPDALTQTFTVPAGTVPGNTRMRVAMKREASVNPCGSFVHGEVEDYTLNISAGASNRSAPVLAFEAYPVTGNSILEWFSNTTDLESIFEIEHSTDDQAYTKIDEVAVVYYDEYESFYKVTDDQPEIGDNYYRIKQIFKDGTIEYSETEKLVYAGESTKFRFYPNPANEVLNIELENFENKSGKLQIINMLGQVMEQITLENNYSNRLQIPLHKLENGMHTLVISIKGKPVQTELFIVEHMK